MAEPLRTPYVTRPEARRRAEAFLAEHHPSGHIPIPIDFLVERAHGIDIVPCHGVDDVVEGHGFLSSDLSTIYIDWDVYHHRVAHRYRSTVAHELGHLVLHAALYRQQQFLSLDEYLAFVQQADEDALSWLETQADWFMGFVLVPARQLDQSFTAKLEAAAAGGLQTDPPTIPVIDRIARSLAQDFCVSPKMIRTRLRQDRLVDADLLD